jgi:hypothetical protein
VVDFPQPGEASFSRRGEAASASVEAEISQRRRGSGLAGTAGQGTAGRGTTGQAPRAARRVAARAVAAWARGTDPVPWLTAAAVFGGYFTISLFRYLRLQPTSWDLGIFTEYVKQYADLRAPVVDIRAPGLNLLGDHFHPAVAVLAPFFRVFPSPVTLLAAQALLAALSLIPVSRAASELLGRGAGRAIGAAYGLSWGLQQLVNYDFHEIALAVPLLAASLSALVRGRFRAAVWWALPLVFVKEDQGFTVAAIGLVLALRYRRRVAGWLLAAWGLVWSLLAVEVIIPYFNPAHRYPYWSVAAGHSGVTLPGLLGQLMAYPSVKLPTLALILLPTVFLALRSPLALVAVPGLALRFVATSSVYWTTDWHYNATVMPVVFVAAIDGLAAMRSAQAAKRPAAGEATLEAGEATLAAGARGTHAGRAGPGSRRLSGGLAGPGSRRLSGGLAGLRAAWCRHGPAMMLAVSAALCFQFPVSQLWSPLTYALGAHVAAAQAAMARVPDGTTVATDLDLLAPLAARTDTFWLGNYRVNPVTEYILFDSDSTDWQPPPANVPAFVARWFSHGLRYRLVYRDDGVYLFRRAG